ncbi:MAG: LptF/LptG family permease [Cyclobacteriaceae bacterium]|jgi:lipopolysaccharide export system permease protein|nr:LptF/LptG family permease [Cytophagales bacterium]MCZ8327105.1 LptF/LptG family permease [Cyclobacteriaceae bacterium]
MKKLDKFILQSFIGPFILTFLVVVFILLMQHMLKYFDDIIGKGLDSATIGQLLFYFAIFMIPVGLPLAVLLASLITYGNLGEHFELTAIKASGISLTRTLRPIFFFVAFLTCIAFYTNNYLVPKAALEAYSLLYDIKQKKPALEIRAGTFFNGIPDVSIKVNKKFPDGETLKDVIIYDHRKSDGNKEVTIADSGRMSTFFNEQYLKLELFKGYYYSEGNATEKDMTGQNSFNTIQKETISRTRFDRSQVVFDLSSFQLNRTEKKWFQGDRIMRNLTELQTDIDSLTYLVKSNQLNYFQSLQNFFSYYNRKNEVVLTEEFEKFKVERDSIAELEIARAKEKAKYDSIVNTQAQFDTVNINKPIVDKPVNRITRVQPPVDFNEKRLERVRKRKERLSQQSKYDSITTTQQATVQTKPKAKPVNADSLLTIPLTQNIVQAATSNARQSKSQVENNQDFIDTYKKNRIVYEVQWHKIIASSMACIAMFLIGAPLGAIIKRGGLGVPFLVSILFFIIYYVLNMQGEKLAKNGVLSPFAGVWMADGILLVIGLFFLRQARADARLFDTDFYAVTWDKWKQTLKNRKNHR